MAAENRTEGLEFRTPVKERFETFNICFGGALGVGKTTLFEYLKSDRFVERSSDETRDTGVDVSRLERQVDGTDIKVRSRRCTCSSQVACVSLVRAVLPFFMRAGSFFNPFNCPAIPSLGRIMYGLCVAVASNFLESSCKFFRRCYLLWNSNCIGMAQTYASLPVEYGSVHTGEHICFLISCRRHVTSSTTV